MNNEINMETLLSVLTKMLGTPISRADYKTTQLHGGTVGDVRLVTGAAEAAGGGKLPYKVVLKTQKKWERPGDPESWRREYDLYVSDFGTLFTDSFRWPECYHAEMNGNETETQLWMEYIDGVSGYCLTVEMFERAAYEIGRFQGRLYTEQPAVLQKLTNLSKPEELKDYYLYCRSQDNDLYACLRSIDCEVPKHLREMLIADDDNAHEIWERIERLPVVQCHRDFWVTNIFYRRGGIVIIDWDTAGWGYMGEDVRQLLTDEIDIDRTAECYLKCVQAYYEGFTEYADVPHISLKQIYEFVSFNLGRVYAKKYIKAETPEEKRFQIEALQKIYEMRRL